MDGSITTALAACVTNAEMLGGIGGPLKIRSRANDKRVKVRRVFVYKSFVVLYGLQAPKYISNACIPSRTNGVG